MFAMSTIQNTTQKIYHEMAPVQYHETISNVE